MWDICGQYFIFYYTIFKHSFFNFKQILYSDNQNIEKNTQGFNFHFLWVYPQLCKYWNLHKNGSLKAIGQACWPSYFSHRWNQFIKINCFSVVLCLWEDHAQSVHSETHELDQKAIFSILNRFLWWSQPS